MSKELNEALLKLQQNIPEITKDAKAVYGRYATLAHILSTLRPVLNAHGFILIQYTDGENLITELRHVDGGVVSSEMPLLMGSQKTAQALGSALTYARRYSILILLGIAPDDDDDGAATVTNTVPKMTIPKKNATNS